MTAFKSLLTYEAEVSCGFLNSRKYNLARVRNIQFQSPEHKVEHLIPASEVEISCKGSNIIEKGLSSGEIISNQFIFFIRYIQQSMEKESKNIKG